MAKRKRLKPSELKGARPLDDAAHATGASVPGLAMTKAPISEISGDAALHAAFDEVADALTSARKEGRLIVSLPLDVVDERHLVRDRIATDDDDMDALVSSLSKRGQQTPIEVEERAPGQYGLISGWRRLTALQTLYAETQDNRFATVQALVRHPHGAGDAYIAMVEENEVRSGLSFYERARIAVQAARQNVYPDVSSAVHALFASARAPKRSKILSFTTLVDILDEYLQFPTAIPEKVGLALVAQLQRESGFKKRLILSLRESKPATVEAERAVLDRALTGGSKPTVRKKNSGEQFAPDVFVKSRKNELVLSGDGVSDALIRDLKSWLKARY